jgi:hypothetical protein
MIALRPRADKGLHAGRMVHLRCRQASQEFIGGMTARRAPSRRAVKPEAPPQRGKGAGLYGGGADRVTSIRRLRAFTPKSNAVHWPGGAGRSEVRRDRRLEVVRTGYEMDPARTCSRRQRLARRDRRSLLA